MSTDTFDKSDDSCDECGSRDVDVSIEVRETGTGGFANKYSKEPMRIVRCRVCGAESHELARYL